MTNHLPLPYLWWERLSAAIEGRPYTATVRMEWADKDWLMTKMPVVFARSRASAAVKAMIIAQKGAEEGWTKITLEDVNRV